MKKLCFLLFAITLYGNGLEEGKSLWDYHPLHVGGNLIAIGDADVEIKHGPHDGDLSFNKENLFTYFFLPVSKTCFFIPRVEWNAFTLNWDKNPYFKETNFHYMQFALTFFTIAIDTWRWILRTDYNIDIKHFAKPGEYGLFSALMWGTHEIHDKWHFHIGALGYRGFEGQEVYPIIGFDYKLNKKWFFQAVFPINYSIEYSFNKLWKLSFKARPLKERFRVGKDEPVPRSIFSYSSVGTEFNLHYEQFLKLELEFFAGYNFGGDLYFKDRNGEHAHYNYVKGAPYIGATLNWGI